MNYVIIAVGVLAALGLLLLVWCSGNDKYACVRCGKTFRKRPINEGKRPCKGACKDRR